MLKTILLSLVVVAVAAYVAFRFVPPHIKIQG